MVRSCYKLLRTRKRIKGVIINKIQRGIRLFEPGVKMMEDLCGIPVLGIIPYYRNIHIEEEDSVGLDYKRMHAVEGKINIAVCSVASSLKLYRFQQIGTG